MKTYTNLKNINSNTKFTVFLLLASFFTILSSGCGYHMGSLMHPQVKSVYIAPVTNETLEPFVAADLRNALCEQVQFDGSLKLKSGKNADCIIFGRVVDVKTVSTTNASFDGDQTFRAAEWEVQVTFEYEVIVPGKKRPLIPKRRVTGNAKYQIFTDQQTTRRRGVQQACRNAARQTIIYTTEAW
jgi:outer membrane lipopolysaccharide assembly protein LptE/RlpB